MALLAAILWAMPARGELKTDVQGRNYLITSKEDLVELMNTESLWGSHFLQTADIDLSGVAWTPIGNGNQGFTGTYNGLGHKIKNLTVKWDTGAAKTCSYGMFGYIGAVSGSLSDSCYVKNLTLENARLTRTPDTPGIKQDVKLGLLAGAISLKVKIKDVSVDGRIDDGGTSANMTTLFVGGLIGDIASSFGGSSVVTSNYPIINNVAAHVDISLPNIQQANPDGSAYDSGKNTQFNVGGIVGRFRKFPIGAIPTNTIYSGDIDAPYGIIGPLFSVMRQNTNNTSWETTMQAYAGEASATTVFPREGIHDGRRFTDYRIKNHTLETPAYELITDTYPSGEDRLYDIRSFKDHSDLSGSMAGNINNTEKKAMFQGVNVGTYRTSAASDADSRAAMLDELTATSDLIPESREEWAWDPELQWFVVKAKPLAQRNVQIHIEAVHRNYTANVKDNLTGEPVVGGSWQWYKCADIATGNWVEINGATTATITATDDFYYLVRWTPEEGGYVLEAQRGPTNIIYVYNRDQAIYFRDTYTEWYPQLMTFDPADFPDDGDDQNNGLTPQTPVRSMAAAYDRLYSDAAANNMVVVMGFLNDHDFLTRKGFYAKAATITGTDNLTVRGGVLEMHFEENDAAIYDSAPTLQAPTRFEDIHFFEDYNWNLLTSATTGSYKQKGLILYCDYHDLTIGNNVGCWNYRQASSTQGIAGDITWLPYFTVVAGNLNANYPDPIAIPTNNRESGRCNIELRSGSYARIIGASRNNSAAVDHRTSGHPDGPARVHITVNINSIDPESTTDYSRYGYTFVKDTGTGAMTKIPYTHDIGLLACGQTDGSCWSDVQLDFIDGRATRIILGSLTFGRDAGDDEPDDSFFGRSVVNIYGGTVNELYGGSLGRMIDSTNAPDLRVTKAYFYGQSVINMYGGHIARYNGSSSTWRNTMRNVEPCIYGAGAGGVNGLGTASIGGTGSGGDITTHTLDQFIPYIDGGGQLQYGDFAQATSAGCSMPVMTMYDGTVVDLSHSSAEVNLYGGTVDGSVYGAGFGYSDNLTYRHVSTQAGALFGNATVRMLRNHNGTTPTVKGNIYGAGAGTDAYAKGIAIEIKKCQDNLAKTSLSAAARKYYEDLLAIISDPNNYNPEMYSQLGQLFGDCEIDIQAGVVEGEVYAGSKGVEDYKDMAAIFGSTKLTVEGTSMVLGDIYGGCEFASVYINGDGRANDGCTSVTIDGQAVIGNRIFGGCKGTPDVDDVDTQIQGSTYVTLLGGSFYPSPWFDPDKKLNPRNFNIYGGGYQSCIVRGDTHVRAEHSLLSDYASITEDASNEEFRKKWNDTDTRRFCIYGGGHGEKTYVEGTADIDINVSNQDVLVHPEDGITFYPGKTFFDVNGGGYHGDVYNTDVKVSGNTMARKVMGGGLYGSVRNATNVHLKSGMVHSVYGGCLMGYVWKRANLTVGNHTPGENNADNASLWVLDNVYGANDVQGIVGIQVGNASDPEVTPELLATSPYDSRILYQADVDDPEKGVFANIYGGTIFGNVFGAGDGHYRGYYVPGWGAFMDGADRFYREVPARHPKFETNPEKYPYRHRIYKTRPTVGRVNINVQGNTKTDRVDIRQSFFGGGRDCTVGQWNCLLQSEDPRRLSLEKAGHININFGSHVSVGYHMHVGARGHLLGGQPLFPDYSVVDAAMEYDGDAVPAELLDPLGDGGWYHWHYDGDAQRYRPGFPAKGKMFENPYGTYYGQNPNDPTRSYFLTGEHQFFGFLKFIEMAAKVQVSFVNDPWDASGQIKRLPMRTDGSQNAAQILLQSDAEDVVFESFYLGGEHGFMTYEAQTSTAKYAYDITIPYGVTILNAAVAGGEDTWISYYPYTDNYSSYDTSGGSLYELRGGLTVQSHFADSNGSENQLWVDPATLEAIIVPGERLSQHAIRLNISAQFEPQLDTERATDPVTGEIDQKRRYGGLIFGGCYKSGMVAGDVVLNVGSNLLGSSGLYGENESETFGDVSALRYNVGRVFGGGFGENTINHGNTYVYLVRNFTGFNVFGGSMLGTVEGKTNVTYVGNEHSYIYGSIYGGGLVGEVGLHDAEGTPLEEFATNIELYSGNVDNVYGGGCMGDVYGGTNIYAADKLTSVHLPYLDLSDLGVEDWGTSRLIAGTIYGGNDVAGRVYTDGASNHNSSTIHIDEVQGTPHDKDSPGSHNGYNGFPLVGGLYGGSNGDYGTHTADGWYAEGSKVYLATGDKAEAQVSDLSTLVYQGRHFRVPSIDKAIIRVTGGTIINLYGGGARSTVNDRTYISVEYEDTVARAGFATAEEALRMWNVLHLSSEQQFNEVLRGDPATRENYIYDRQIYRAFGGNDKADMSIQPHWDLTRGHIGSVYSGGNMGRMTYYNPDYDPNASDEYLRSPGLSLFVAKPDIRIDAVYGGSRVGDIVAMDPMTGNPVDFVNDLGVADQYGATVNIHDGIIESVYGGNDVAGDVVNGTRVNITGAISGDVYGSGNGSYLYRYDLTGSATQSVSERYLPDGTRYFLLKALDAYGGTEATPAQRLMAINSYRPNVSRSRLDIRGVAPELDGEGNPVGGTTAYVKGNVYCGGNSSTVSAESGVEDIEFYIGSNVVLNGVYLGSNGEFLANGDMIQATEQINDIGDIVAANDLTASQVPAVDLDAVDTQLYPTLLSLYMRAVEVSATPRRFDFDADLTEAYIGEFCVGGNSGSMMTAEPIHLQLPERLVVYGRIVGGCHNANVTYKGITHHGGLTKPLATGTTKVKLDIACRFKPLVLQYPYPFSTVPIALHEYMVDDQGKPLYEVQPDGSFVPRTDYTGTRYYADGQCNIYGGCYTSGTTVGDICLNVYSDMIDYAGTTFNPTTGALTDGVVNKRALVDGINDKAWYAFNVIGGGYGAGSEVRGDIYLNLMPGKASPFYVEGTSPVHPSAATVFGGSRMGLVVGNTNVALRDGTVLTNVYGASEAAVMYGSPSVAIGYPDYYKAVNGGNFSIIPADDLEPSLHPALNHDLSEVVRTSVSYRAGDIVPKNVYDVIDLSDAEKLAEFTPAGIQPSEIEREVLTEEIDGTITSTITHPVSWNDIKIEVGDQHSQLHPEAPFYGHGNVYGGGFIPNKSSATLAGKVTVFRFDDDYNLGAESIGKGGNTCVMIWDNKRNADLTIPEATYAYDETAPDDASGRTIDLCDHVSVATGHYAKANLAAGADIMGYYVLDTGTGEFNHQPSGEVEASQVGKIYEFKADGGVYGGGRKVFVEGLRSVDIAYYGYADHAPQHPKLINTFQRADLVSVEDCSLMLQGATDFATNNLDATLYSINRVGSLHMHSSLPRNANLDPGEEMGSSFLYNLNHSKRRSRNYIAFFHSVNYLGALSSDVDFASCYHNADGTADASATYISNKHDAIKLYDTDKELYTDEFMQRNVGTSANMIGINNGYALRIQGYWTEGSSPDDENYETYSYYGPVYGVAELKLLTLAQGEGGGYVYARNHHYNSAYDTTLTGPQDFLHTTGNFVFPGAAYLTGTSEYNYIIDDCMPMLHGYYEHLKDWESSSSATPVPGLRREAAGTFDVNEVEDVHYWYVNGQKYFFNLTLTAYTGNTASDPKDFYLDNDDGFVLLAGTVPGSDIKVEKVEWDFHSEHDGPYECDITNLDRDYSLRITVDSNPRLGQDHGDDYTGAYVTEITRKNYSMTEEDDGSGGTITVIVNGTGSPGDPTYLDPNATTTTFGAKAGGADNSPVLGVRLTDAVNNGSLNPLGLSAKEYYEQCLKDPHKVKVVLSATDTNDVRFEYNLLLTIRYLLGPDITGNVEIENCALPGEYIYANSNAVDVVVDDSLDDIYAITAREWWLYPLEADGTVSATGYPINSFKLGGTDREVRLPAYWYQNGWELRYGVKVSGHWFYASTDDASEHPSILVHNYHRMYPFDGTTVHDLKLVSGARVYIEDDADMHAYLQYVKDHQEPVTDPDETTYDLISYGIDVHPQYCEGINFFLQNDVVLPNEHWTLAKDLISRGNFHGNGHTVHIGTLDHIPFDLEGKIFNTGFYSESTDPATCVFNKNVGGTIQNCFYFNINELGTLAPHDPSATVVNCYQNSRPDDEFRFDELMQMSTAAFSYGQICYNLNGFYLQKRDHLLEAGADNITRMLREKDIEVRGNAALAVGYVESMFNNGDYQYAFHRAHDQFAQALRTTDMPNYCDMMDLRSRGLFPSHHDGSHPHDDLRWDDAAGKNWPRFSLDDYIFFGEDLTSCAPDNAMPAAFVGTNRVYRASGFYGDKADKGSFFNVEAHVASPKLTAIDVSGYRDADPELLSKRAELHLDPTWDGWIIEPKQQVYYPPTLDLPYDDADCLAVGNLTIDDNVTRNLLFYSTADDTRPSQLHYQDALSISSDHDYAVHPDDASTIRGHHVIVTKDTDFSRWTFNVHQGLFHLVDRQLYDCPIRFHVSQAWYNRQPKGYADGTADKSAWEGIYLPFDVKKVFAISTSLNPTRDHGEITHFYGDSEVLHEYWLRRFTGSTAEGDLVFERPTAANAAPATDLVSGTYTLFNTFFFDTYASMGYVPAHNAYRSTIEFPGYRHLTGGVPYILSFPGERYYEFDMSGEFFRRMAGLPTAQGQSVCYLSPQNSYIAVTQDMQQAVYSDAAGYALQGTFKPLTVESARIAAVTEYEEGVADGTTFDRCRPDDVIDPFRIYLTMPTASSAPHRITGRGAAVEIPADPEPEEDEDGNGTEAATSFEVRTEGSTLIVTAPYPAEPTMFDALGRAFRVLPLETGENRFYDIPAGVYILLNNKIFIR